MKKMSFIFILFYTGIDLFGTAQIPDFLIYNGDTLSMYVNPLEDYFNEDNPRPKNFFSNESCLYSTACWRGYIAYWKIENNKLYLHKLSSCCSDGYYMFSANAFDNLVKGGMAESDVKIIKENLADFAFLEQDSGYTMFEIEQYLPHENIQNNDTIAELIWNNLEYIEPESKIDSIFGSKIKKGKVLADWYSGTLKLPKGKLIEYVHMGYGSIYEKEIHIKIEKGRVKKTNEFDNTPVELPRGYKRCNAITYNTIIPEDFNNCLNDEYSLDKLKKDRINGKPFIDTICFYDSLRNCSFRGSMRYNSERIKEVDQKNYVEKSLKKVLTTYKNQYKFKKIYYVHTKWGYLGWITGKNKQKSKFIRIYALSNFNLNIICFLQADILKDEIEAIADNIGYSLKLKEFGY